ncbi:MAG: hypothetical protein ACJAV6_000413 [Candidatus Paceibacteria bacterium]|jgi:hypothetical protein
MKQLPINKDQYQVYVLSSRTRKPVHFAVHTWIVTVSNGKIDRWEILHQKSEDNTTGYFYRNAHPPVQGLKKGFFTNWDSNLIGSVSGDQYSLAKRILDYIENRTPTYPHQNKYSIYPGPNSNTYVAWILKEFPTSGIKLPWNAFGKNY